MGLFGKIRTLCKIWDTKRFVSNCKFLLDHDLVRIFGEDILTLKNEIMDDCAFELDEMKAILLPQIPHILGREESLTLLETQPKSFARYGDGEQWIIEGKNISFQDYDPVLAQKMLTLLQTKRDDIYVGINDYFHAPAVNATELSRIHHRRFIHEWRAFLLKNANHEIQYLHAGSLIGYFAYDREAYGSLVERRRKLFQDKKVVIVTAKNVLAKLDYDIFELAASKVTIDAPSMNAFRAYDSILREIEHNVSKDSLICIILGPTATAMAADLTDMGYLAWDVGHMAKDYDAYMKNLEKTRSTQWDFFLPD